MHDASASEDDLGQSFGLSLRELIRTFRFQTLVLLKAMILQPKVSRTPLSVMLSCADPRRCSSLVPIASESARCSFLSCRLSRVWCGAFRTARAQR